MLMSVCTTMLAMLRCTNTSPGAVPVISLAGTRLSEHPIHRNSGVCVTESRLKKSLSSLFFCSTHALFCNNSCWYDFESGISKNKLMVKLKYVLVLLECYGPFLPS